MNKLTEEQKTKLRSWARDEAAAIFFQVIDRESIKRINNDINTDIDNYGKLAYNLGKKKGIEEIFEAINKLSKK